MDYIKAVKSQPDKFQLIYLKGYVLYYVFFEGYFNLMVFDRALFKCDPEGCEELRFEEYPI